MSEIDLSAIKAGEYELLALSWDEITSKPGQPYDFVTHRQGDTVTLDVEQARRLVVAGAVKPKKPAKSKGSTGGTGDGGTGDEKPAQTAAVNVLMKYIGDDKERAAEYLAGELARDEKDQRSTFVEKLKSLLDDGSGQGGTGTGDSDDDKGGDA